MAPNWKISLIWSVRKIFFYMKKMLNHIFSKVDSIDIDQNILKIASNDTFSNLCSSNPYVCGWFISSAYFWAFLTNFVFFSQGKEGKRQISYHICVNIAHKWDLSSRFGSLKTKHTLISNVYISSHDTLHSGQSCTLKVEPGPKKVYPGPSLSPSAILAVYEVANRANEVAPRSPVIRHLIPMYLVVPISCIFLALWGSQMVQESTPLGVRVHTHIQ